MKQLMAGKAEGKKTAGKFFIAALLSAGLALAGATQAAAHPSGPPPVYYLPAPFFVVKKPPYYRPAPVYVVNKKPRLVHHRPAPAYMVQKPVVVVLPPPRHY
jgi:hypothetical protein